MPVINPDEMLRKIEQLQNLKAGGMSHSDACAAMAAIEREGREVGSVEEELERAAQRASAPVDVDLPPVQQGCVNILILGGMGSCGEDVNFFADNLLGKGEYQESQECRSVQALWKGMQHSFVNFAYGRANAAAACLHALQSTNFHAVVIADLSVDHEKFVEILGEALQAFVHRGGRVAFLSSEGLQLQPWLNRLFSTGWVASSYYRTSWVSSTCNVAKVCRSSGMVPSFSAKACSVSGVPLHEQLYTTTPTSRSQSYGPPMNDQPVGTASDPDVAVATHSYGRGCIAYFGDINGETETCQLVLEFCRNSKLAPTSAAFDIDDRVIVSGLQAKPEHNGKVGQVVGFQGDRVQVSLFDADRTEMALKPSNLHDEQQA